MEGGLARFMVVVAETRWSSGMDGASLGDAVEDERGACS